MPPVTDSLRARTVFGAIALLVGLAVLVVQPVGAQTPPPKNPTVTICKVIGQVGQADLCTVAGDGGPAFTFTTPQNNDQGTFTLTGGQMKTFEIELNGQDAVGFKVTELLPLPDGYTFNGIECTADYVGAVDNSGRTVEGTLTPGQELTCWFYNSKDYDPQPDPEHKVTVRKFVVGANAPTSWSFPFTLNGGSANLSFELTDADNAEHLTVGAGLLTLTETDTGGAAVTQIECEDENEIVIASGGASVEIDVQGDVVCEVTNTYRTVNTTPTTQPTTTTTTTTTTSTTTTTQPTTSTTTVSNTAPTTTTTEPPTVLGDEATNTTTTTSPAQVLGDEVAAPLVLPVTGSSGPFWNGVTAALGLALVGFGLLAIESSRRQLRMHGG